MQNNILKRNKVKPTHAYYMSLIGSHTVAYGRPRQTTFLWSKCSGKFCQRYTETVC